jgi:hypothetical protein
VALPDQARLLGHDDRPRARRLQLHAGALSRYLSSGRHASVQVSPQHSPNILSAFERSQTPPDASTGAASFPALLQKGPLCGPFVMELAGLEPATSWVRFRSAASPNPLHKRVSGQSSGAKPLGYPALTQGFWGSEELHPQNERTLCQPARRRRLSRRRCK